MIQVFGTSIQIMMIKGAVKMEEFIYEMINKYGLKTSQIIEMYETLQKVSEKSNLSVEETVKLVRDK